MHKVVAKLKCYEKKWSQQHFGIVNNQIKKTKELLWKAKVNSIRDGNYQEVGKLKAKLNKLCDREE